MYRNYEPERIYSYFLISFNSAQWFKTFWTVFILPPLRLCWPGRKQYFSVSTPVSRPLSLKHVWHSNRHDSFRDGIYRHIQATSFQESGATVKRVSEFVARRTAHVACIFFFLLTELIAGRVEVRCSRWAVGLTSVCGDIQSWTTQQSWNACLFWNWIAALGWSSVTL